MGNWISRNPLKQLPYFEHELKKIQAEEATLAQTRAEVSSRHKRYISYLTTVTTVLCFLLVLKTLPRFHVSHRKEYTDRERVYAALLVLAAAGATTALLESLRWLVKWRDARMERRLAALQRRRRQYIADLKDRTKIDLVNKVLEQYDPEIKQERARRDAEVAARVRATATNAGPSAVSSAAAKVGSLLDRAAQNVVGPMHVDRQAERIQELELQLASCRQALSANHIPDPSILPLHLPDPSPVPPVAEQQPLDAPTTLLPPPSSPPAAINTTSARKRSNKK